MNLKGYVVYNADLYRLGNQFKDWNGVWALMQMHYEPARDYDRARATKAADPNVRVLLYRNVRDVYLRETAELTLFRQNGWLLKNAQGEEIADTNYNGNRLCDKGNPAYQQWVADWIKTWIQQGGFDGAFLDNGIFGQAEAWFGFVGATSGCQARWPTQPNYCPPINPRTKQPFTNAEWLQAELQLNQKIKAALGNIPLFANGTVNGGHFFLSDRHDAYAQLIQAPSIDGWMIETFMNDGSGQYYTEQNWKFSVDYIAWIEQNVATSKSPVVTSHWATPLPSGITHDDFVLYTYASVMLAAGPNRKYFSLDQPENTTLVYHGTPFVQELYKLDLGYPLSAYYVAAENTTLNARVYARPFSKGFVMVNPTQNALTVTLPREYLTMDGTKTSQVTVQPHRGMILLSATIPVFPNIAWFTDMILLRLRKYL